MQFRRWANQVLKEHFVDDVVYHVGASFRNLQESNIVKVRKIQSDIKEFYAIDARKHDARNKLKIRKIYDMIPSMMENKSFCNNRCQVPFD
jgi:hypothetical protein